MSTPRTWTLNFQNGHFFPLPQSKTLERVEVIEKEPVLDLLERHLPGDGKPRCAADRETLALLRANGRLKADSDE